SGDKKRDSITQRSAELPFADGALHKRAGRGKGVARVEGGIAENERDTAPVVMTGTLDRSHLDATFPRSSEFRRVRALVDEDFLDGRGREVQRALFHSVHNELWTMTAHYGRFQKQ